MPVRKQRRTKKPKPEDVCKEFLNELELHVKEKLKVMDEMEQSAIDTIESIYNAAEMNLPKHIREMTVKEYKCSAQGDLSNLLPRPALQNEASSVGRTYKSIGNLMQKFSSTKKKTASNKRTAPKRLTASPKAQRGKKKAPCKSDSSTLVGKKGQTSSRKTTSDEVFASPPRLRKRVSSSLANRQIITPKFDLRKPVAANKCRVPRPGETLVSLSGSPLQNRKDRQAADGCVISLGGKVLDLGALVESSADLDEHKKRQLQEIQEKIARLVR